MNLDARDPLLGRIERRAAILTITLAVVAAFVPHGGSNAAAGVLGGALLSGVSYWAIKRGITGLADAILSSGVARQNPVRALAMLLLRYAVLGGLGYLMIARLRLNPLGLLAGASVMAAAAMVEATSRRGPTR
jgi:hypothetical protein